MGENTTIDNLAISIDLSGVAVAKGLSDLSDALGKLKNNGSFKTVSTNLNHLSQALKGLPNVYGASNSLRTLANSIEKLKDVGTVSSLSNSLKKLPEALKSLEKINLDGAKESMQGIADAAYPLTQVKSSGFSSMVNSMAKLKTVTDSLDETTIGRFAEKIKRLNEIVGPLATKMGTIKTAFAGINTQARAATKAVESFDHGIETSTLNMSSFINVARTFIDSLRNIVLRMGEFIDHASQWEGISARFGRGFGEGAQETYEWVKRLNEEMGINIQQFMQYSSVYATMLTGFGVANKDATKMALGYAELTYDIWAGYNDIYRTFDEAAEAVRSAIAGEVEPVRRAGFTILESTLQQTAANHGLEISIENATEAQKSYLRYLTLVDQAHAQGLVGTYAKEMNTAEGVMRTFEQQLKSLTQAFGSLFLPILVKIMPYIQAFVELLTEAVHWFASLIGIELQKVDFSGYEVGSGAIDNVADSAGNATDALGSAAKAAKELKNATLGIDELNVISPSTASSGAGGGSGSTGAGGGGFAGLDVDSLWDESILDSVKNKVGAIVDKMKDWLGITDDVDTWAEFLDTRLSHILTLVGLIGGGIAAWKVTKQFMDSIDALKLLLATPKYAIAISAILTIVGLTMAFTGMADAIRDGLDGFNFAETLGGALLTTSGAALLGSKIVAWLGQVGSTKLVFALAEMGRNLGVSTAGALGAALGAAVAAIIVGIPMYVVGIYDAIVNELDWLNAALINIGSVAAGAGIGAIIGALGGPIGAGVGALIGLAVGLVTTGITLIIQEWDTITEFVSNFFTVTIPKIWDGFVGWCKGVGAFFTDDVPRFFTETIPKWGNDMAYGLGYALGTAVQTILDWWSDEVVPFFTTDIPKFFTETIPAWGEKIKSGVVSAFTKATQAITGWWNNDVVPFFTDTIPQFFTVDLPTFFKGLPDTFKTIGENIVNGVWDGITGAWDWLKTTISGWCDNFVQGFKDALGIHSPSKVFADIGKNIVAGLTSVLNVNAIKDKLSSMWTTAKNWWDSKKTALKAYTPSIGSIYEKVKDRWDNARTWWNEKKSAMKTYTPSIGSIYEKVYDRWKNARDWWNGKKGSFKIYTPSIGSITDKLKSAWNSAKSWWNKNVKLSTKLNVQVPTIKVKWDTASAFGKSFKYPTGFSLKFAANGGIFDQGSLIWAGERGPEVMATAAGGKTGVMNVQQMQDAVYEGVYAAVSAAMRGREGGGSQSVNVYLDGRQITAAVEQRQRERGASIFGNEVYAY